ncbi:MAG: hypothetical protein JWQ20_1942 [Conexibacter sp.]|nr:hypothetical protein [Conexibacter sp.]
MGTEDDDGEGRLEVCREGIYVGLLRRRSTLNHGKEPRASLPLLGQRFQRNGADAPVTGYEDPGHTFSGGPEPSCTWACFPPSAVRGHR